MEPSELFEDMPFDVDGVQLVDINLDNINQSAQDEAVNIIDNLSRFYYDEDFMKSHPSFKKRVDTDLESLRVLFKMRKSDEEAHDLLIKAIAGNSGNASLYKSLSDIQKTIISITSKINDIIEGLNNMMKGYQLELNFDQNCDEKIDDDLEDGDIANDTSTHRGAKDFINQMNKIIKQEA